MAVGGRDFTLLGRPLLPPALVRVDATVVEKTLSRTKIVQHFKKREQFRKIRFVRERWTLLRIGDIHIQKPVD
jgi:large subunit ribosomal protein L21